jgi:hypothetical protein
VHPAADVLAGDVVAAGKIVDVDVDDPVDDRDHADVDDDDHDP